MNTIPERPQKHRGPLLALFKAIIDPRTPLYAKALPVLVMLYVIFPFDIIPDVIPFAGWIDDLLIIPAGLWLATRYIPQAVMLEADAELAGAVKKLKKIILVTSLGLALLCALITATIVLLGIWILHRT